MAWVPAALSVVGAVIGAKGQKDAAKAQAQGAQGSMDWIKSVYGDSQGNLNPYIQGGQQGLQNLLANNYTQSPGYQYLKDETMGAVDARNANAGSYWSGGANLDMARHINGLAAQDYQNWWNNQMGLAQLGAQAGTALGGIGSGTFNGVQSAYSGIANAAGAKAGANAGMWGSILNGAGQIIGGASQSAYGGGSNASNFGLPPPVDPYANTNWGSSGSYFG